MGSSDVVSKMYMWIAQILTNYVGVTIEITFQTILIQTKTHRELKVSLKTSSCILFFKKGDIVQEQPS